MASYRAEWVKEKVSVKSKFFKELTPPLWPYELHGQGKKKKSYQNQRHTYTSHYPTKTISKSDTSPINRLSLYIP